MGVFIARPLGKENIDKIQPSGGRVVFTDTTPPIRRFSAHHIYTIVLITGTMGNKLSHTGHVKDAMGRDIEDVAVYSENGKFVFASNKIYATDGSVKVHVDCGCVSKRQVAVTEIREVKDNNIP